MSYLPPVRKIKTMRSENRTSFYKKKGYKELKIYSVLGKSVFSIS